MGKVLGALRNAGLTVKPSKCEWGRSEIRFLGHVVSPEGLATQPKVTTKVQEFGRPHDKHTVRSFLGLANYYRNFIPGFAEMAVPLNGLLKKRALFDWSPECEQAFKKVQTALVNPPLLIHPEIGGHFYVHTDASDEACGGVVCHLRDDILRPIVYYSYTMNKAEKNYAITEREALAVIKTLKSHEGMLHGGKLTIVTDHQPLVPLLQQAYKASSARLKRWALALSDFDFEITYQPGSKHHLPDYLSRVVLTGTPAADSSDAEEFEPEVGCELLALDPEEAAETEQEPELEPEPEQAGTYTEEDELTTVEILREQRRDPECRRQIEWALKGVLPNQWEEAQAVLCQAETMGLNKDSILCKIRPH